MRELVSYDDIASQVSAKADASPTDGLGSPPKKRRKNNHRQGQKRGGNRSQYRDGYEEQDVTPPSKTRIDYGLKEESRQLTHEDVWDDSALIRAWDAAVEEYEVLNGAEKKWKNEPVNKSSLWFNIPPEPPEKPRPEPPASSSGRSFLVPSIPAVFTREGDVEEVQENASFDPDNSHPVNFDTFVPQHDPSLSDAKQHGTDDDDDVGLGDATTGGAWRGIVPPVPEGMIAGPVAPSEAFERAMGAWYWAGYWTGVYHSGVKSGFQSSERQAHEPETADEAMEQEEQEVPSKQVEGTDLLVPT